MTPRRFKLCLAALAIAGGFCFATANLARAEPPATQPASARQTPPPNLERTMKGMNKILKTINKQIDDAAQDASTLSLLGDLQAATATAKGINPDDVDTQVGDARTKAIADYRSRMIALLRTELVTEEALLRNDHPAAKTALASLAQQRKDGHEAYGVKDDHH